MINIEKVTSAICSANDSQALDHNILIATDLVDYGVGNREELCHLFRAILERLEMAGDREEALTCLWRCTDALGSLREIDLSGLLPILDKDNMEETEIVIGLLSNSDQAEYIEVLERLTNHNNADIREEALDALDELRTRTS